MAVNSSFGAHVAEGDNSPRARYLRRWRGKTALDLLFIIPALSFLPRLCCRYLYPVMSVCTVMDKGKGHRIRPRRLESHREYLKK